MPLQSLQVSGSYFYPQVNASRNNPESLIVPVSSTFLTLGPVATSASLDPGGRYWLKGNVPFYIKFFRFGVDANVTTVDPVVSANIDQYLGSGGSTGISVLVSGSVSGSMTVTKMGR